MARVLVLNGPNHSFDQSAPIVHEALGRAGHSSTLTDDKNVLADGLADFQTIVLGTGFTRRERLPDGSRKLHYELSDAQADGLYGAVRGGIGFVGIHGTGWWIGGEAVKLTGGAANWHPPGLEFTVKVDAADHPIMAGISDFIVNDEIYMSAWDPSVSVLASASWNNQALPMAWTHAYGKGRVFFTTLGHGPNTFEVAAVQRMLANAVGWTAGA
ncbi:MAG: ThuA domain-containing protein [Chloroflexota bacterium]|nr:MAG: ThuA domain-containing protein [Chloroflexota bacterium]